MGIEWLGVGETPDAVTPSIYGVSSTGRDGTGRGSQSVWSKLDHDIPTSFGCGNPCFLLRVWNLLWFSNSALNLELLQVKVQNTMPTKTIPSIQEHKRDMEGNLLITLVASCLILACSVHGRTGSLDVTALGPLDVTKYGAKPGGNADMSQALLSAWKEACASTKPSKIVIPEGTFLLSKAKLEGPCKAPIELQVQGTVNAPSDTSHFNGDEWLTVQYVNLFTLSGKGTFDGQGAQAWTENDCKKADDCSKLPNNLSFNFLTSSTIRDITSKDSKLFHVNLLGCSNLTFQHFTISAPGDSPNTDGIHVARSKRINITDSTIETGDDCVSIGDGAQQVSVTKVTCGPGHGISVGSLGKNKNEEPVVGIYVKNCTFIGTSNGVRVKTWPASEEGTVTDMHVEDIIMKNVSNPVIIDQQYCPHDKCIKRMPSRVKISKIRYNNIRGTSATPEVVTLLCSKGVPCKGVEVGDIDVSYIGKDGSATSSCANVQPQFIGKQNPPVCAKPAQTS